MVAESWLVFRLTGSSTLLGMSAFAAQIPVFLFASIGGTVADRFDRHRIIVITQTASMGLALILAALTLADVVRVWHVFVLAACLGVVNAFDIPARQVFVVDLVGREDLVNAIALNSSLVNGARVARPVDRGPHRGHCRRGLVLSAERHQLRRGALEPADDTRAEGRPAAASSARLDATRSEGFRFVIRTAPIRALLLLLGIVSFAGMPYAVLMPIFAESILHGGARGLGMLMGASGLGALAGTLTLATRSGVRGLGRWVLSGAAAFGVALVLFSLSRHFWLSALLLVPAGAAMMVQMASSNTLIQAMVPDALRGRVMAVYSMMFMGMAPFGSLFAGTVAERIGAPKTIAIGGLMCIGAAAVFAQRLPALRVEARQLIVAQGLAGGDPPAEVTGPGHQVVQPGSG